MEAMNLKKFNSLSKRDFENGAALDEIAEALKQREQLLNSSSLKPAPKQEVDILARRGLVYTVVYGKNNKRIKTLAETVKGPVIELSLQEVHRWYSLLIGAVVSQAIGIDLLSLQKYGAIIKK